jgi:hypothetical protein
MGVQVRYMPKRYRRGLIDGFIARQKSQPDGPRMGE